jgi:hypothetical protein
MAIGVTRIAQVVVPEVFTPYFMTVTEEKTNLINAGVLVLDDFMSGLLAGPGRTYNLPGWNDLDNDDADIANDDPNVNAGTSNINTHTQIGVGMTRHKAWSSMVLADILSGENAQGAIANRVGGYWSRQLQRAYIATMNGVFADNDAAVNGDDTHTVGDLTHDVSTLNGGVYAQGVTDFSVEHVINALALMGDSAQDIDTIMMHSIVKSRMEIANLIDTVRDSENNVIETFRGRRVIEDDSMPNTGGVYETWLLGNGSARLGIGVHPEATELDRKPAAGNGSGQDILHTRVRWMIHPVGHAFIGSPATDGGPSNAASAGNLADAASWSRRYRERKQIKIVRLKTREHA